MQRSATKWVSNSHMQHSILFWDPLKCVLDLTDFSENSCRASKVLHDEMSINKKYMCKMFLMELLSITRPPQSNNVPKGLKEKKNAPSRVFVGKCH